MLVDCEKYLGNFCFRVNFKFFLDVIGFADKSNDAGGVVFYNVWLGRDRQLKSKCHLVGSFFLFFQLCIYIKKQLFCRKVLAGSFSL